MSVQKPDYPTEYRGNTIYDEKRVADLSPDMKPNLSLVEDSFEIDKILDYIGVDYDRDSIILEDNYNCLWVDTNYGEYTEVWGIHHSIPHNDRIAVRLK